MTVLTEMLEQLTVRVSSPDGNIKLILRDEGRIECAFRDEGTYREYDADSLAAQLSSLFCSMENGRVEGWRQAFRKAGYDTDDVDKPHWDAHIRRYREAVSEIETRGRSHSGMVMVKSFGNLKSFRFKVHPKALETLDSEAFVADLYSAYVAVRFDCRAQRNALKREYFP